MSDQGPLLEVAANSVASALAAQEGGANRIELCAALEVGGLTPSYAQIALARERVRIPIYVLIRPRTGDLVYSDSECERCCATSRPASRSDAKASCSARSMKAAVSMRIVAER